jgi:bacteriorhodopsin
VLIPLSVARTDSVAEGIAHPPDAALVEGYRWAFYAGAALAVLGALVALMLIRAKAAGNGESRVPDHDNP